MICRRCKKNVESSMRHAIAANSCPFCGNSIFDTNEFAFRKSVSRVLIKNGLDNDDQINKIVDDILSLAAGTPVQMSDEALAAPVSLPQSIPNAVVAHATTEEEKIVKFQAQAEALAKARAAARTADDDGLTDAERYAPARVLSPAPKPTAQLVTRAGEDPIALAMREFSAAQDLDAKFAREDQIADRADVTEDDRVFFMEAGVASEKAERLKGSMSTGNARPAFRRS